MVTKRPEQSLKGAFDWYSIVPAVTSSGSIDFFRMLFIPPIRGEDFYGNTCRTVILTTSGVTAPVLVIPINE